MKELYEKVYIKTEADLPKTEDFYPVQRKDGVVEWETWEPSKDKGYIDLWLKEIDYYLCPVEQEEECYPEKFIWWLSEKNFDYSKGKYYQDSDGGIKEFTLPELFTYWKERVNN